MSQEQRKTYRVQTGGDQRFRVRMEGDETAHTGTVADLSAQGLGASFPADDAPALAMGCVRTLRVSSPELSQPLEFQARVCSRVDVDEVRRYGFEFVGLADFDEVIDKRLYHLFNRRRSLRVGATPMRPVRVVLEAQTCGECCAEMVDLSTAGVGLMVDAATDACLASVVQVEVRLNLPWISGPTRFDGRILRREAREDRVFYGVEFLESEAPDFAQMQERLFQFIVASQREDLRRRAG